MKESVIPKNIDSGQRDPQSLLVPKLHHITKLTGDAFVKAFNDCFCDHLSLWNKGSRCRGFNTRSLMHCGYNEMAFGVLHENDATILNGDEREQAKERTGAAPFMARKLLLAFSDEEDVAYLHEFDVESFAYVLMWITGHYDAGELANNTRYNMWTQQTNMRMLAAINASDMIRRLPITSSYESYTLFVMKFVRLCYECAVANREADEQLHAAELRFSQLLEESTGVGADVDPLPAEMTAQELQEKCMKVFLGRGALLPARQMHFSNGDRACEALSPAGYRALCSAWARKNIVLPMNTTSPAIRPVLRTTSWAPKEPSSCEVLASLSKPSTTTARATNSVGSSSPVDF